MRGGVNSQTLGQAAPSFGAEPRPDADALSPPLAGPLDSTSAPVAAGELRTFAVCALVAAGLHLLLWAVLQGRPAQVGEPLLLRWLRLVDQHPVRCGLASALALWAAIRGRSLAFDAPWENAAPRS